MPNRNRRKLKGAKLDKAIRVLRRDAPAPSWESNNSEQQEIERLGQLRNHHQSKEGRRG